MLFDQINAIILKYFYYLLLAVLFFNMFVGRKGAVMSKRRPVFFFGFLLLLTFSLALFTERWDWPSFVPTLFFVGALLSEGFFFRVYFFPFRFRCRSCGKRLSMDDIFIEEDYLCHDCKEE